MNVPQPRLSVVIPTLNEAERLPALIAALRTLGNDLGADQSADEGTRAGSAGSSSDSVQIIVSDGGSADGTVQRAQSLADHVIEGSPGRGGQLNRGAELATAPLLFFIHADSRFTPAARDALHAWLANEQSLEQAAVFRFQLDASGPGWRVIEWGQAWRQRLAGIAFGDQGLVIPRTVFDRLGGYPDVSVMEDARMMKALRRAGVGVHTLSAPLITSARRYQRTGRVRSVVRNQMLLAMHALGIQPRAMESMYAPEPGEWVPIREPGHQRRSLLVFAKAPEPGKVKTRLAADVGNEAAARLYRALAEQVLTQVTPGAHTTTVCFAPAHAEPDMRAWLGDGVGYRAQAEGDLGHCMDEALTWAVDGGGPACVIGTDAPDVDGQVVDEAFAALQTYDVVIGPASDGGYYLLGLNRPHSALFQGIAWSTGNVLDSTLAIAAREGLKTHLLGVLTDVDHVEDVPAELRNTLSG